MSWRKKSKGPGAFKSGSKRSMTPMTKAFSNKAMPTPDTLDILGLEKRLQFLEVRDSVCACERERESLCVCVGGGGGGAIPALSKRPTHDPPYPPSFPRQNFPTPRRSSRTRPSRRRTTAMS